MPAIVTRTQNLFGYAGYSIPSIAFGTWKLGNGQGVIDQVDQALANGFDHIGGVWTLQEREPGDSAHWHRVTRHCAVIRK
jgi:hypothetical protein